MPSKAPGQPLDLIIVMGLSALAAALALFLEDGNPLRMVMGLPLVLFFPGYVVVSALWPGNEVVAEPGGKLPGIGLAEKFGLSIGLSLVLTALIGIFLHLVWDILLVPVVITLISFTLAVGVFAWYRRAILPEEQRFVLPSGLLDGFGEMGTADKLMAIVIAVSIISSLAVVAYIISVPYVGETYSEFYVLDSNGTVQDLPTQLDVNQQGALIIGIISHENATMDFTVVIRLANETGEIQNRTLHTYDVTLENHGSDETSYSLSIPEAGEYLLIMELYKDHEDIVYREIHLWVDVS